MLNQYSSISLAELKAIHGDESVNAAGLILGQLNAEQLELLRLGYYTYYCQFAPLRPVGPTPLMNYRKKYKHLFKYSQTINGFINLATEELYCADVAVVIMHHETELPIEWCQAWEMFFGDHSNPLIPNMLVTISRESFEVHAKNTRDKVRKLPKRKRQHTWPLLDSKPLSENNKRYQQLFKPDDEPIHESPTHWDDHQPDEDWFSIGVDFNEIN